MSRPGPATVTLPLETGSIVLPSVQLLVGMRASELAAPTAGRVAAAAAGLSNKAVGGSVALSAGGGRGPAAPGVTAESRPPARMEL